MPSHAEAVEQTRALLKKIVDAGIPGVILCIRDRKGDVLFHDSLGVREVGKADEPMKKGDYTWIASCTKLITCISALQLVEQGKAQLDETVDKVLPQLENLQM